MDDIPTLEELKEYAKYYGYGLIKNQTYVKRLPCTCGRKQLGGWHTKGGVYWKCPNCGKQGPVRPSERKASMAWNEMIENETR